MPTKTFTSPFGTTFRSAVNRGTPVTKVVQSIATRKGTTSTTVFNSLFKAGLVDRQKFNGKFIYFPTFGKKAPTTIAKGIQVDLWQTFVEWAIASGQVKPEQITNKSGSQQQFITFLKKFFGRQGTSTTSSTRTKTRRTTRARTTATKRRRTTTTTASRRRTTTRRPTRRSSTLRLTGVRSTTSRRLRRAA